MTRSTWTLAALSACLTACSPVASYPCSSDGQCDRWPGGRCEDTRYCSYPADSCASGFAYDGLAPASLAGTCVPATVAEDSTGLTGLTQADASTGTPGSTGTTGGGGSSGTSETGGSCPQVDCEDRDGDGFGIGEDCPNGPDDPDGGDCDDDNPARADGCHYLAPPPAGDDANPGTKAAPWGTFAHALAELGPADSLVLLDGDYDQATTGLPDIDCTMGIADGLSGGNPISIRAENDRRAYLRSDGGEAALRVSGCHFWRISGLAGRTDDQPDGAAAAVTIASSEGIVLRRLLFSHANRYTDSAIYRIDDSHDILVEDSEGYDFHRAGVHVQGSDTSDVTFRRTYLNSTSFDDLDDTHPGRFVSDPTYAGDVGFALEGSGHRLENCIVHGEIGVGIDLGGSQTVRIEGTVVVDAETGIDARSSADSNSGGHVMHDVVVLRSQQRQLALRSVTDVELDGITLIGGLDAGLYVDELPTVPCSGLPGGCSVTAHNLLALDHWTTGVSAYFTPWTVDHANAYGNAVAEYGVDEPIDDAIGHVQFSLSEAASGVGLDSQECAMFIPAESSMHGVGVNGADIGANVLYRVVDGITTDEPLWDPTTGAFPCGSSVAGISDVPGASCSGVHQALHVNHYECQLPDDYGVADCG